MAFYLEYSVINIYLGRQLPLYKLRHIYMDMDIVKQKPENANVRITDCVAHNSTTSDTKTRR